MLLICGQVNLALGQHLIILGSPEDQKILKRYTVSVRQPDSSSVSLAINNLISELHMDGYFTARAEHPIRKDTNHWEVRLLLGDRYEWAYLSAGNLDPILQEKSGFRERFFLNRPFSYQDIKLLMERVLKASEDEGFPFASVQLAEIEMKGQQLQAEIYYQPGPYITFGKLYIHGTDKVKADFLATQLSIQEGSAYSERKLQQISAKLRSLPYLTLEDTVDVRFQNDEAELHLTLSDRESNQVDGLVNFLPNENEAGKVLLTGRAEIMLNNLMRSGKQFALQWQRLQTASQQLAIAYQHPYFLRTPLQTAFSFQLLKEDTLFLNRKLGLQFSFPLINSGSIGISTEWQTSSLLGEMPASADPFSTQMSDFSTLNIALTFQYSKLDDVLFPSHGFYLSGSGGVGRKRIAAGATESGKEKIWQPYAQIAVRQYHPAGRLFTFYHRFSAAFIESESLFLNELYRLGGIQSLRGFNDNFFFASYYALSNFEARLVLEQERDEQSYLYVFYDQAWLGYKLAENKYNDTPAGLGAGISFTTNAGVFNLAYALGKSKGNAWNLSLSKIHFGYISRF